MREVNPAQAYNYKALIEDLEAVRDALPYTGIIAATDESNYKDGFAVLSLSSPYYLSGNQALELVDSGRLRDAFTRCDYSQIYAVESEVRIYFIVEDVWKIGEELPAPMTINVNRRVEEKIRERKLAKEGPGLHIIK